MQLKLLLEILHISTGILVIAANVLKNGPKLSIVTKAGIFQLYLSRINGKIR